ncbi:MAG: hypothetical protein HP493_06155 [Nitrospira sp.]|nr:hypothetical protein [Nitrospira sp.]
MKTCDKCHGAMLPERAVDLDAGLAITVFACLNCGRRKDKCHGAMLPERAVDLDAGLAITVFACLNCGRRKAADQEPRPITARH